MAKRSKKHRGAKTKSFQQVQFLLSKVSPLSSKQKSELKRELKSGAVKVTKVREGVRRKGPRKKK